MGKIYKLLSPGKPATFSRKRGENGVLRTFRTYIFFNMLSYIGKRDGEIECPYSLMFRMTLKSTNVFRIFVLLKFTLIFKAFKLTFTVVMLIP